MSKINKHIEIVRSLTPGLSSMGQKSCDSLLALLKKHYSQVDVTFVSTPADLIKLVAKKPDLVFMGMKYVPGSLPGMKVWVAGFLDEQNIAHTGSTRNAVLLEQNKPLAKQRMMDSGIKTSPYMVVIAGHSSNNKKYNLQYPLFVKPAGLGAGAGVDEKSIVHNEAELTDKIALLQAHYNTDVLIEKYLSGREFSVGVIKDEDTDKLIALPLELVAGKDINGNRMLSYKLKSGVLETPVFPVTEPILRSQLMNIAVNAFQALGARDYGRIDIRLDERGIPHFLEANLIPCIIEGSGNFPKACVMNLGLGYEEMILRIVRLGLSRQSVEARDTPFLNALLTPLAAI